MSPTYTIQVTGISPESTQTKLDQFFSFCGRISNITLTPGHDGTQSATIQFEKESAAKTALLLNEGTLDGAHLHVSSGSLSSSSSASGDDNNISQEDKPKAGIIAEYLAHGYVLSDQIVERAIEADKKQGISNRFLSFIKDLDSKAGAKVVGPEQTISAKAHEVIDPIVAQVIGRTKEVDQQRGISTKAGDYYSKALSTPIGQKVYQFYTETSKQVVDVHTEARRIADEKKNATTAAPSATPETSSTEVPSSSTLPPALATAETPVGPQ
ncbi:RNA recognition motif domain [Phaffia rhodozyma]|uniref:RNA recognition motif domain n=1 Tax=Phaffia rhodozyma TaxID=264483 RepID=A0A0F7SIF5_PHARH|nr:RNA recognition motif domain [Phaffia rhodozyma]